LSFLIKIKVPLALLLRRLLKLKIISGMGKKRKAEPAV
jgi:hypothetical protein